MFSDHLRKIDEAPHKTLLLVAAGLVMVCQLVAMALVAGEQVQKAQMRGDSQASRQVAVASCVETSRGVAVKDCFRLGSSELEAVVTPATSTGAITGFMPASFATHW
jgi:hypothetical protein